MYPHVGQEIELGQAPRNTMTYSVVISTYSQSPKVTSIMTYNLFLRKPNSSYYLNMHPPKRSINIIFLKQMCHFNVSLKSLVIYKFSFQSFFSLKFTCRKYNVLPLHFVASILTVWFNMFLFVF